MMCEAWTLGEPWVFGVHACQQQRGHSSHHRCGCGHTWKGKGGSTVAKKRPKPKKPKQPMP